MRRLPMTLRWTASVSGVLLLNEFGTPCPSLRHPVPFGLALSSSREFRHKLTFGSEFSKIDLTRPCVHFACFGAP